ncbi:MAG: pyridoxamine 5'-phosphate oxidase family protein [Caulobacter sp.]|nr:pyridoxamine 5'-phosphate oxidase family protein [Vitreoscilla sp.]
MYDTHDQTAQGQDKLTELIKDIKFGMFTTHKVAGHLHSRPMTTQNKKIDDDALWFFMSRSGDPVSEFKGDDQVNVSYANPSSDTYVSVTGVATVVEDQAKKQALWNKAAEAWFKGGINDPDLALVRVSIEHADYWDVKESKLVQLYKMAEAAVSGTPPKMGEHGHIRPH